MRLFVFMLALMFSTASQATEYKVLRVLDGDTVEIAAPFLPKELKQSLLLRMEGIDTPEIGGKAKCPLENKLAQQAKEIIQNEIAKAKQVNVVIVKWDKYGGRVIGKIFVDNKNLSDIMIASKLAYAYAGKGKKKDWCQ
jgi:endonuclease YncB( thermonuclease family)